MKICSSLLFRFIFSFAEGAGLIKGPKSVLSEAELTGWDAGTAKSTDLFSVICDTLLSAKKVSQCQLQFKFRDRFGLFEFFLYTPNDIHMYFLQL